MKTIIAILFAVAFAGCAHAAPPKPPKVPQSVNPVAPVPTLEQFQQLQREVRELREELRREQSKPLPAPKEIRTFELDPVVLDRLDEIERRLNLLSANLTTTVVKPVPPPKLELLVFGATWCGPCRVADHNAVQPFIAGKGCRPGCPPYKVIHIDVDIYPALKVQHNVQSVPTYVALVDGKEVNRLEGSAGNPKQLADLFGMGQ